MCSQSTFPARVLRSALVSRHLLDEGYGVLAFEAHSAGICLSSASPCRVGGSCDDGTSPPTSTMLTTSNSKPMSSTTEPQARAHLATRYRCHVG